MSPLLYEVALDQAEAMRVRRMLLARLKTVVMPPFWRASPFPDGAVEERFIRVGALDGAVTCSVIVGIEKVNDVDWVHLSVATPTRLPSWDDLVQAKEVFIGVEVQAVQVFAPRSQWVNLNPFCLHIWAHADSTPITPDFRRGASKWL